jgi:hypothetical protein
VSVSVRNSGAQPRGAGPTLMRVLMIQRHWQKFSTFQAQFRKSASELAENDNDHELAKVSVSPRQWERWYAGSLKREPHPDACRVLEHMFGFPISQLLSPASRHVVTSQKPRSADQIHEPSDRSDKSRSLKGGNSNTSHEAIRRTLEDSLARGAIVDSRLKDWERLVLRYGRATRDRSAQVLVEEISSDLIELSCVMEKRMPLSSQLRLTHVTAELSGLMSLLFCLLDDRPAFHRWARTARLAASEVADPPTLSWVLAQEAHGHFYSGDLHETLQVARHASDVTRRHCVGTGLAAAIEARACAVMGRSQEMRSALDRAETVLSHLSGDDVTPSAFGYHEGSLRFHESNCYTHLQDVKSAFEAQDRALALCSKADHYDWALTRLDRAQCLIYDHDVSGGLVYATETFTALAQSDLQGLIRVRGQTLLDSVPERERGLAPARDLKGALMLGNESKDLP